jgi:alkanesulfonate monooxygenase SsuD/methylene tetrahydromethanopterin reductase-like flavin-dependent oxidoreductase (luciferase family)
MAAETQEAADRAFSSRAAWRLGRDRGIYAALPTPDEVAARAFSVAETAHMDRVRQTALFGTPKAVGDRLRALGNTLGVDEIAILSTLADPAARRLSYTLLAGEFGLPAEDVGTHCTALAAE